MVYLYPSVATILLCDEWLEENLGDVNWHRARVATILLCDEWLEVSLPTLYFLAGKSQPFFFVMSGWKAIFLQVSS